MNKSPLVSILKTFSKKEIREFRKWLHSPFHNQRQDIIKLFEFFFEDNHLHKEGYLDKPTVFSWTFPKETYDDAKMRQVIFFLMQAVEQFLAYQEFFKNPIAVKSSLAKSYRKRTLDKSFEKTIKSVQKAQEEKGFKNEVFYRNNYALELERYAYLSKVKRLSFNLQEISDSMDIAFIAGKLRQSCLMLTHQNVYKKEYDIQLINEILELVEKENYLKIPLIATYFFIYKTITEKENETHYQNLKEQIIENGHIFPIAELRDIYLMAINYSINKMNEGFENFIREAFELYQEGFKNNLFIENNSLSRWTFLNVIANGLKLKEFEWIKQFIETYQVYLEDQYRDSVSHYSMARFHFESKDYVSAMRLLNQVEYDDHILMYLSAKIMLCKIYYEEEEVDALESLLESIRIYLQRKKVVAYHKANYKNIIRYTKKLTRTTSFNIVKKEKLIKEIEEANPLTEKEWLLEQLNKI